MRSRLFRAFVLGCFAAAMAFPAVPASAWEKGHVKISPSVKYEQQWDSNIFYDTTGAKKDFISLLTPGIGGEFGFGDEGKHKLRANYSVECGMFAYYNSQNYANQDVSGELALDFNKHKLTTGDRFLFTSDRAGTEFNSRVLRKENLLSTLFEGDYNKLSWDAGYSLYNVNYLSDTLKNLNRYDNAFWTTGYMEIQPKTKALIEFKYTNLQYPDASGRNGNDCRIMTGLKGDITAKITGIAKVGFETKWYNGTSSTPAWTQPSAEVGINYKHNDRTDLLFSYMRAPYESTYTNNNYYTGDHFLATLNYKKRLDYEWAAGGKVGYMWKEWIVADVGYKFHARESNIYDRNYDENIISGSVKAMY
jgi:hypothetical protein